MKTAEVLGQDGRDPIEDSNQRPSEYNCVTLSLYKVIRWRRKRAHLTWGAEIMKTLD
jgi:hypothetical protein